MRPVGRAWLQARPTGRLLLLWFALVNHCQWNQSPWCRAWLG